MTSLPSCTGAFTGTPYSSHYTDIACQLAGRFQIQVPDKPFTAISVNPLQTQDNVGQERACMKTDFSHIFKRFEKGSDVFTGYALMGVGQRMIAHLLGHRHVGTTDRNTHVAVETTAPLVEKRWGAWKGEE